MSQKSFFDTGFSQVSGSRITATKALRYLIQSRNCILPEASIERLYSDKPMLETPMNVLFRHLREEGKALSLFAPVYLTSKMGSIPEFLTSMDVTFDTAQLTENYLTASLPELAGKTVVNLGDVLRTNRNQPGEYSLMDTTTLHNRYVRGAMVMSYNDSDGWLTPALGVYLAKSYTMVISAIIAKFYDLVLQEQMTIGAVLTMYMCQQLMSSRDDYHRPALWNRCTYLGSTTELERFAAAMRDHTDTALTIKDVCDLISKLGPARMHNFSPEVFYRLTRTLGSSTTSSLIAVEYPPYWCYELCVAMSNGKTKLYFDMKANRLQEEAKRFLYELDNSQSFIGMLPSTGAQRI